MATALTREKARALWIQAQGLDRREAFGKGPKATVRAIEHLGYVQIDTINVIERCHHHILYTRIPSYQRKHLHQAQSLDKSIFEYWAHALAYIPTKDFQYFVPRMKSYTKNPGSWFQSVSSSEVKRILQLIRKDGAISIRDIEDDLVKEKEHLWGSRKPSKKVLQYAFHCGKLTISERLGMLKKYELTERHFDWEQMPKPPSNKECLEYRIERAFRSQCVISLESATYLTSGIKSEVLKILESKAKKKEILSIQIEGLGNKAHWIQPERFESETPEIEGLVHLLSPFDPLVIQRKRLKDFFEYEHVFEAYVPKEKRRFGYFALPVLCDDQIVAALDLKTDRENQKLLIQKWTWLRQKPPSSLKKRIEEELHRFEKFQLERKT